MTLSSIIYKICELSLILSYYGGIQSEPVIRMTLSYEIPPLTDRLPKSSVA